MAQIPSFGNFDQGASSSTTTETPPGTASGPTTTVTPAGPDSAGLNPIGSGESANTLSPEIANKPLPGESGVGAQPATKPEPYDEKQLVQELADHLGVKAKKGSSLEAAVADDLAKKYGVKLTSEGETTSGTGTGQGAVGQLRHNIASWFNDVGFGASPFTSPGDSRSTSKIEALTKQITEIKNPQLKAQAQKKLDDLESSPQNEGGPPGGAGTPVPTVNKKALQDILTQVGEKLGIQGKNDSIGQIDQAEGLPTGSSGAATPGVNLTAGQVYGVAVKELADTKTAKTFASSLVGQLETAGLLDKNASGAAQTNGTKYTNTQILNAYQQVLQQQVQNNQTQAQAISALQQQGGTQNGPTSEMEAYVQGVAQEFGVGLTEQQITQIANTYGANALVADQPSSVEDEIKDAVVALYDPNNPSNPSGVADTMYTNIQQAALQYQIPISPQQIGNMVKQSLQGATVESMYVAAESAMSDATKQFQLQAEGLYPSLAPQIQAGNTVQNLTAPYFNVAEAITGVPASTMMADQSKGGISKWAGFLQGGQNPAAATKQGGAAEAGPQMMTLDEWKKQLMTDPQYGFQNTTAGKQMGEQMAAAIANEFGKVSTMGGTSQPFNAYQGASDLSANTA